MQIEYLLFFSLCVAQADTVELALAIKDEDVKEEEVVAEEETKEEVAAEEAPAEEPVAAE